MSTRPAAVPPRLHIPEEPMALRDQWHAQVVDGAPMLEVLSAERGVIDWLWARWRTLDASGLDEKAFAEIVCGYRREVWFWLAGERTWNQCCSGLLGRLARRIPA